MPRFAANLTMLYPELDFLDRFEAAAADGFEGVEFFFPYAYRATQLSTRLRDHGLELVFFNATPRAHPDDRGIACLPDRKTEFRDGFLRALEYAQVLSCRRLHVMAGIVPPGADLERLRATFIDNLTWCCAQARAAGRDILIEPINPRDMPGFLLSRQDDAHAIIKAVGAANLKVQMDLYHCQIVEGDVAQKLRTYLPTGRVGHLQIAGVPDRHEPDTGELAYGYLFDLIDESGYTGWTGCEYHPRSTARGGTSAGLEWMRARQARREPLPASAPVSVCHPALLAAIKPEPVPAPSAGSPAGY
ncbi:2-oxo-tetronate isomerase [Pigmentiphaga litoralis]|uniref:2-oxo-tetronate isomerase n=1 Tax=Pigmentiphaga litoralis TaxID=516702 RepID=UPI003B42C3C1